MPFNRVISQRLRKASYAVFAMSFLSLLALALVPQFMPSSSFAADTPTVNPSLAIGGNGEINLTVQPGQFNSTSQTVTVTTSNYTGYTMTISSVSSNTTELINTGTSATIPSISTNLTRSALSALTSAAYGLSTDNGNNYIPVTNGSTIKSTNSANNSTSETFNLTLGAKTNVMNPSGSYVQTFVLTATANAPVYTISYNSNAGTDIVTGMPIPNPQTTGATGNNVLLSNAEPQRTGYTFLGWSTSSSASTASYSAGGLYTLDETTANSVTLYAVWQVNNYTCTKQYRLQNADGTFPSTYTADGTSSVAYGSTCSYSKTVTDYRGSSSAANGAAGSTSGTMTENGLTLSIDFYRNTYTLTINKNDTYISSVSGGGSGKLWGSSVSISATPASIGFFNGWSQTAGTTGSFAFTSNASTTFTMPKSNATIYADGSKYLQDWNGCSSLAVGSSVTLYDNRDEQAYTVTKYNMGSDTAKCWMSNLNLGAVPLTVTELNSSNTHLASGVSSVSASTFNTWIKTSGTGSLTNPELIPLSGSDSYGNKYGTLYNYAAISAGTYAYADGQGTGDATSDLCPASWRLPTGGSSGEFQAFYNANSPTFTTFQSTYGFSLAGFFAEATPGYRGQRNICWSSTKYDGGFMYDLYFDSGQTIPLSKDSRAVGISARCIAQTFHTLTISTGTGISGVTVDGVTYHNGDTVNLEEGTSHTINMTFTSGYEFDSWSVSGTGSSVASTSTQSTTLTMGTANSTLTANGKAKQYLQDWNGCDSMNVGDSITLYDNRDDQAYTVSKYNMGNNTAKCWMSNLNLGAVSLASGVTQLDNTNTNLPNDSTKFISASTFNSWIKSSGTASYTSPELIPVSGQDSYSNKYGTLYNYAAASAGTYAYVSGSGTGNAQYSLCPSGWRLPTGGSSGEFQALYNANSITSGTAGVTKLQQDFGFSLAGYYYSTPETQGSIGYYWSSTRNDGYYMYDLYFFSSYVNPGTSASRAYGYSVRCIKQDSYSITYNANGGSGAPDAQSGFVDPYGTTLSSTEPTRANYVFAGWSRNSGTTPGNAEYKAGGTYTDITGDVTLYAIWATPRTITVNYGANVSSISLNGTTIPNNGTINLAEGLTYPLVMITNTGYAFDSWTATSGTIANQKKSTTYTVGSSNATITGVAKVMPSLQSFNCSTLAVGGATEAYDTRDNQVYTVSKYNMGNNTAKCWMSNLNLGATQLTTNLTSSNTNISSTITASTFNSWIKSSGTTSYTSPELIPVTASNSYTGLAEDPYGNKYGTLYNYAAASANTINAAEGANNNNAQYSLCPSGWRLPTGGSSGEFQALYNANSITSGTAGVTKLQQDFGFSLAGYFKDKPSGQGYDDDYWSSTRDGGYSMYALHLSSSYVGPANSEDRRIGQSVRCIKE